MPPAPLGERISYDPRRLPGTIAVGLTCEDNGIHLIHPQGLAAHKPVTEAHNLLKR
jgi:hypothetical protein